MKLHDFYQDYLSISWLLLHSLFRKSMTSTIIFFNEGLSLVSYFLVFDWIVVEDKKLM